MPVFDIAEFGTRGYLTVHVDIPLGHTVAGDVQPVDNGGHREPVHEAVASGNGSQGHGVGSYGGDLFLGWFGGGHGVCGFGGTAAI